MSDEILPLPRCLESRVLPSMILPEQDFGGEIGVRKGITLRDFLLVEGVTDREMQAQDAARREKGMQPLWEDER